MKTLDGKVILVTGGARGLGEAICKELGSAGARVILADIRMDLAEKVAAETEAKRWRHHRD
jgi:NAD(P)-dependent dehydrogenase (short-subunit alcohol dehydrogenase family)